MQILQHSVASFVRLRSPVTADELASRSSIKIASRSAFFLKSAATLHHHALVCETSRDRMRKDRRAFPVAVASDAPLNYAAALADFSNSKRALEAVNNDMETLSPLLQKQELYDFLANPVIEDDKKKSILKTLAEDAKFQKCTLNFLYILIDTKRIDLIKEIIKEFEKVYNRLTDTQVAIVTSAIAINSSQLSLIAKKIQSMSNAKNVRLKNIIDPTLIAGFMIKFGKDGSRLIDLSVKGQLEHIAAQLESTEKVKVY